MRTIIESLKRINWKLYRALLFLGLCPAIYTTVRTFFLGQMPGDWAYSIAGQLSWVNLLYEIIDEAIILPLFFFMGKDENDRESFSNKLKTGLIVTGTIYILLAAAIMIFAVPLLSLMAASPDIVEESAAYIRIESVANVFGILFRFALVALVTIGADKAVYLLTGAKVLICLMLDSLLVSQLPFSLDLGVNGIGVSNIISNLVLFAVTIILIARNGYRILEKTHLSFAWMKDFVKVGGISGMESLVRNVAYMVMVSRMVNMVGEQGTYWVANNFIWGWMLLPVIQLGELIKQEVATDKEAVRRKTKGYFALTAIICVLWVVLIPLYKPFMLHVLGYSDVDKLFSLVMTLFAFYVLYAFQNVFDATFYGAGRTDYMLFESIVTNSIYYGAFFVAFITGAWIPTLTGIALMFGFGNAFDSVVSWIAYRHFIKHRTEEV